MRKGEKVIIDFKLDGTITTEGQGFKGKSCLAVVNKLLEGLNKSLHSQKLKSEYYANETATELGIGN